MGKERQEAGGGRRSDKQMGWIQGERGTDREGERGMEKRGAKEQRDAPRSTLMLKGTHSLPEQPPLVALSPHPFSPNVDLDILAVCLPGLVVPHSQPDAVAGSFAGSGSTGSNNTNQQQ